MPIRISDLLPARAVLDSENIFVMTEQRASSQDIRPLKLVILNLMPTKITTETQILRCLSNTPLQIEIELLQTSTYQAKNTAEDHLLAFYTTFDRIKNNFYDGMIITGAPVETLPFEEVAYWPELCQIMEWSKTHVQSTFHICWGAQAGLYYHYGITKRPLPQKMFGIFEHHVCNKRPKLVRGFDDVFLAPHSRHTGITLSDLDAVKDLQVLAVSETAGLYLAASRDGRHVFVTGHAEYDADTLAGEYFRDIEQGLQIDVPHNYFPDNDPSMKPRKTWRSHAHLLYTNWLNYCVYQETSYDISLVGQGGAFAIHNNSH